MKKQMPGYEENQKKLTAEQKAKKMEQAKDKATKEFVKLQLKKYVPVFNKVSSKNPAFRAFVRKFFLANVVSFLVGSTAFLFSGRTQYENEYGEKTGSLVNNPLNEIYGDDMSYGQAIKNAYLWDDFRNDNGGLFQGICGLISMMIALGVGMTAATKTTKENMKKAREVLWQLDHLRDYGIDVNKLMKDMEPEIKKLVSKMSEKDRGYFENLLAGGLDGADYEICVNIIKGHLKSHPEDYDRLVAVIDENTLPESIKKKYGKTISFGAAKSLKREDR